MSKAIGFSKFVVGYGVGRVESSAPVGILLIGLLVRRARAGLRTGADVGDMALDGDSAGLILLFVGTSVDTGFSEIDSTGSIVKAGFAVGLNTIVTGLPPASGFSIWGEAVGGDG